MKITYPFEYIGTNQFGKIFRPVITISIHIKDLNIYTTKTLVVDSGADITIFPKKDALIFGINLEKEVIKDKIAGVGGSEIIYFYDRLEVKVGDVKLKIPCGFLDRNDVPALLGRQHSLELFDVRFKDHQTVFSK